MFTMIVMKRIVPALLLMLSLAGCWKYVKPRVAIDISNKSHETIKNIEVNYPGGTYGIPSVEVYGLNHHTVEIDRKGCVLTVKFDDTLGHSMGGNQLNLGETCPPKISIVVSAQLAVSAEAGQ